MTAIENIAAAPASAGDGVPNTQRNRPPRSGGLCVALWVAYKAT
jgi:hypothetical protein